MRNNKRDKEKRRMKEEISHWFVGRLLVDGGYSPLAIVLTSWRIAISRIAHPEEYG